jgi:formylglycine-generating enzyme required for sulfatase activity
VGRFRQFVAAWNNGAGYTPPAGSGKHVHVNGGHGLNANGGGYETGWLTTDNALIAPTNANLACDPNLATWTPSAGANEELPVNCVSWFEAVAFCIWDGGFLPSDAEEEYAAAGGSQQLEYPWGSMAPGTASQYAIYGCYYPSASGNCTGVASIAPVGHAALGAGRWGQLDLAGNLNEWNLDYFGAYVSPCTDCAYTNGPANDGDFRDIRGGTYAFDVSVLRSSARTYGTSSAAHSQALGFRCARAP